jgi:hypothetical protein
MKTKKQTKTRRQDRNVDAILKDIRGEFGEALNDFDIIDELALCEVEDEWE